MPNILTLKIVKQFLKGGSLDLNEYEELEEEAATELKKSTASSLYLCGLTSINKDIAKIMSTWKCKTLILNGIEAVDLSVAKELAAFQGKAIYLYGIKNLSKETEAFVKQKKIFVLNPSIIKTVKTNELKTKIIKNKLIAIDQLESIENKIMETGLLTDLVPVADFDIQLRIYENSKSKTKVGFLNIDIGCDEEIDIKLVEEKICFRVLNYLKKFNFIEKNLIKKCFVSVNYIPDPETRN